MNDDSSRNVAGEAPTRDLDTVLHSQGYLALLLVAALLGIPLSILAFGFLAAVHELENLVWDTLPAQLGFDTPPAWWPIATIGLAGVLVALAVTHLPGHGGHVPAMGVGAGATPPSAVPGAVLAAAASLALGAVLGPEAPLIALGSGLALLAVTRTKAADDADATALLSATGSAAAISAIFGNPLVAAVMFLEVIGLARRQTMLVLLPCLLSSGVGALVFTGLGEWTGLEIGALAIPDLEPVRLQVADVLWALPLAAVYAVVTGHSPAEVALSGQATLATLATRPEEWSTGALVLLLVCKGLAYALCLGAFRGGPVFPAVFLGAAFGVLASALVPSMGTVPGLAIGMAAGVAVTRLPVTSVVLVVLLLGDAATSQMPVVILAAVTALVVEELLTSSRPKAAQAS